MWTECCQQCALFRAGLEGSPLKHTYWICLPYSLPSLTWVQKDHLLLLPLRNVICLTIQKWSTNDRGLQSVSLSTASMPGDVSPWGSCHGCEPVIGCCLASAHVQHLLKWKHKENHFPDPFCSKEECPLAHLALFHRVGASTSLAHGFHDAWHTFTWQSLGHFHGHVPQTLFFGCNRIYSLTMLW